MAEYIEREAALKAMEWKWAGKAAFDAVKAIPAADVVPVKHGRWYRFQKVYIDPQTGMGFGRDMYKCNVCNVGDEETKMPYCPNCGAKMDGEV